MSVVVDGSAGITTNSGTVVSTTDATLNGLTVGKGGGSVSTNTAVGSGVLAGANTGVGYNTAVGYASLAANTSGTNNTGIGNSALNANTTGSDNQAFGTTALYLNTTGSSNTAVGRDSLRSNTTASNNTAVGYQAGYTNSLGLYNTFIGTQAGYTSAVNGNAGNTCVGFQSGYGLTTGIKNTFIGGNANLSAGYYVTTGSSNTIIGGYTGNQGGLDIRTSSNYIVLSDGDGNPRGYWNNNGTMILGDVHTPSYSDTKLSIQRSNTNTRLVDFNNTHNVSSDENLRVQLGANCNNTSSYHIICTTGGNDRLYVYGNGNLANSSGGYGTISDQKLKDNIVDATPKLQDLMQLRVRNYNLKAEPDLKQIGFVAQEFEQVFPALVDFSDDKDAEGNSTGDVTKSIKTSVLIPILVKSIQELKALVDAQATEIAELKAKVA